MARYIDADKSVGIGYLCDWYQNSIMDNVPPVWTDEHLEELLRDFIVIPKETPTADVVEVVRCRECRHCNHLHDEFDNDWYFCTLTINNAEVQGDWYCCRGEKENGQ